MNEPDDIQGHSCVEIAFLSACAREGGAQEANHD